MIFDNLPTNSPEGFLHYVPKARKLRDELLATSYKLEVLHGDLHHDNILNNDFNWKVIDPKGVMGDHIYDIATFICNPMEELIALEDPIQIIKNRIIFFAKEFCIPAQRIHDWCFVCSILSWAWAIEDGLDTVDFKRRTEIFDRM